MSFEPVEGSTAALADYIGPHKIVWETRTGFFPGPPQMIRERIEPLSSAARHQVLAGAMGFYGLP
jgi:uncharacterized protein